MGHEYQDAVSLEIAERIAASLPERPEWLTLAKDNLARWSRQNADAPGLLRCYAEWQAILEKPVSEVAAIYTARTDEGQRIRQNSPFAGVLSPREVWEIKRRLRHDTTAT